MHDQPHLTFEGDRVVPIEDRWERMVAGTPWVASCTVTVDQDRVETCAGPEAIEFLTYGAFGDAGMREFFTHVRFHKHDDEQIVVHLLVELYARSAEEATEVLEDAAQGQLEITSLAEESGRRRTPPTRRTSPEAVSGTPDRVAAVSPTYRTLAARRIRRASRKAHDLHARRAASRAADNGGCAILYYHRVASPAGDPWRTSVSPDSFDRQLDFLAAETRVLPLQELVDAGRRGRLPDRAVAVTFDDGYFDNLDLALPILERRQQPATFYVATGLVGAIDPPWWDEIADLMLGAGERPPTLEIKIGREWLRAPTQTPEERGSVLFGELNRLLKELPGAEVESALRPLRAWAGRDRPDAALSHDPATESRMMNVSELRKAGRERARRGRRPLQPPPQPAGARCRRPARGDRQQPRLRRRGHRRGAAQLRLPIRRQRPACAAGDPRGRLRPRCRRRIGTAVHHHCRRVRDPPHRRPRREPYRARGQDRISVRADRGLSR